MSFDKEKLDKVFKRTDGHCHICRKRLVRKNYGKVSGRGIWEVEHSNPRSKGGTDRLNNLYAACVSCNRSKGNSATRSARANNGFKAAPLSRKAKAKNAALAGTGGAIAARVLLAPLGPLGWIASAALCAKAAYDYEPD